jgi:hypothetical protein
MNNLTLSQFKKSHAVLKRFDRISDRTFHGLAWLFVIGVIAILLLAVTGLARRWGLDLAQVGKHIAMFVMFPIILLYFGGGALRLISVQILVLRARRARASKKSVAVFVWLSIVALAILAAVTSFAVRIYSR